jgi:voltage-gated potassium channel
VFVLLGRLFRASHRRSALLLLGGVAVGVLLGGAVFSVTQHLPVTTGWYWAVTTATTVGYGDVTPHNASGRIVASVVMLTTIPMLGAAFALFTGSQVAAGLRRIMQTAWKPGEGSYRLVIGSHPAIPRTVEELAQAGDVVVLVADVEPGRVPERVHVVRGDPTSLAVLRSAHPAGALHALVGMPDDGQALVVAVFLRQLAPDLPVTALVHAASVGEALRDLGVQQVLSGDELVAQAISKTLEAPHAGALLLRLLYSERHRLVEQVVPEASVSRPLSVVREERDELVLGVIHGGALSLGVGEDPDVSGGDVLLVVEPTHASRTRAAGQT